MGFADCLEFKLMKFFAIFFSFDFTSFFEESVEFFLTSLELIFLSVFFEDEVEVFDLVVVLVTGLVAGLVTVLAAGLVVAFDEVLVLFLLEELEVFEGEDLAVFLLGVAA
ncbi:hypothetical protein [Velocimicrobium porci]|uniref:Uncharacterized protein n=1 Tax=Velocimicrobium porci TaxID=2606634 RepID=A0A6L5XZ57_9FIRM|nr:hypothetical protein [Velocimicrobium porci]MSS64075.1 hypothetical protein [Velocimicrobium porci]